MKKLLTYLLLLGSFIVSAQQIDIKKLKNIKPRAIGPAGMSGRITAIDVVNSNPDIIYVGAASGGVWKSESGGIDWKPIFDKQPLQGIGAIAIQQSNPDVIWVGTGEGNPRNSLNGGYGIYKSLDGGNTWEIYGARKKPVIFIGSSSIVTIRILFMLEPSDRPGVSILNVGVF